MTILYERPDVITLRCGDVLAELVEVEGESIQCSVTSPPYWGLRDYGLPPTDWPEVSFVPMAGLPAVTVHAWRGCLGLEPEPLAYVAHMVHVFRHVRRALADDGTLWLNLGDCYATGAGKVGDHPGGGEQGARWRGDVKRGYRGERLANGRGDQPAVQRKKTNADRDGTHAGKHTAMTAMGPMTQPNRMPIPGLKPKDLVGIPWRVAFALQADGWFFRSDVIHDPLLGEVAVGPDFIWAKPNPMPESVKDRPTKAHEYVFLLAKSQHYFFDCSALSEPTSWKGQGRSSSGPVESAMPNAPSHRGLRALDADPPATKNPRSVWPIATVPYGGAHFATMPPALAERCILAGSRPGDRVLDPFNGAGTTGLVSLRHGRRFVGIDLNPNYCQLALTRWREEFSLFLPVQGGNP